MKCTWICWLFGLSGFYDAVIGVAFLVAGPQLFETAQVPPPNHWGYLQFAALLLVVFGLMFFAVALNPAANRNLIPFGALLKVSYVAVVSYYWISTDVPLLFKPFVVIDAVMLVLFLAAYAALGKARPAAAL